MDEQLRSAECLAIYDKAGRLLGYMSRHWQYGPYPDGRWGRWRTTSLWQRLRSREQEAIQWERDVRLLRQSCWLVPVSEEMALARLTGKTGE